MTSITMNDIAVYIESFIPANFGPEFIKALPSLDDVIAFKIRTGAEELEWFVRCDGKRLVIDRFPSLPPRCAYRLEARTFLEIAGTRLRPQSAFFSGALGIDGDMLYALRLGALLEHFFRQFPYQG